jgi:glyoxylase-like metal-dependent hydrolase (beta-lactamase superfamily II)
LSPKEVEMKSIKIRKISFVFLIAVVVLAFFISPAFSQEASKRVITNITGDLYRFQNNFHFSVFLVTPEGVIATDPIDADAAVWLKDEIKKRFNKDVKYLVYSHDHRDHIAGGEVFADTATVIAHKKTRIAIIGEKRPTAVPEVTFNDRLTIELGGKKVDLAYVVLSHSDNMIIAHFPVEKAVYAVDFISVKRLPYMNLPDSYLPDWIEALKFVEGMDFEILIPGHGPIGNRQDVVDHRMYFEGLYAKVLEGARQGKTLEDLQQGISMEKYKDWSQYKEWLPLNIEGIYQRIQLQRRGN